MKTNWGEVLSRRVDQAADMSAELKGLSRKDLAALVAHGAVAAPESDVLAFALMEAATRYLAPKKSKKRTRSK